MKISESWAGGFGGHSRARGFAVAVGQEASSVSSARGHRYRSCGIQVVLAHYDDGDFECGAFGGGLVAEAVSRRLLRSVINTHLEDVCVIIDGDARLMQLAGRVCNFSRVKGLWKSL